jgi:hypothetical protein
MNNFKLYCADCKTEFGGMIEIVCRDDLLPKNIVYVCEKCVVLRLFVK